MTLTHPLRSGLLAALLLGAALAGVTGCGTPVSGTAQAEDAAQEQVRPLDEAPAVGSAASAPVDGCSLITASEVEALIGTNDGGRPSGIDTGGGGCLWENKDNYFSVSVEVGSVGTAAGGTIPAWEPALGPERTVGDDMRDINGGIEFAAGDRDCVVQVSTTNADADRASALELIPKLRERIG